ncbi:sulfite exporter TauE/SafE family protein [Jiulongibacter sp. NS-SX5]|uniref:sulfite exporter TauE/SafE family protein n=1 Tax=Jiulongibacter sp. NS-SX5 TaxID=3463854 RepID=UPI00405A19B8
MNFFIEHIELILLFFGIAVLYSSVGFGGGSSYLAILTLFGIDFITLRAISLLCNITVVSNGTFQFFKKGFLKLKKVMPLALFSIPFAYLGGRIPIEEEVFFIVLGTALVAAAILMWIQKSLQATEINLKTDSWWFNGLVGGSIGFLSGLVGIGGGIFLSPLLYLLKWDEAKVISATASFFILVNSISGLAGQMSSVGFELDWQLALTLMITVGIGGFIGTYMGTKRFNSITVRKATAVLVFYVGIRILYKHLLA